MALGTTQISSATIITSTAAWTPRACSAASQQYRGSGSQLQHLRVPNVRTRTSTPRSRSSCICSSAGLHMASPYRLSVCCLRFCVRSTFPFASSLQLTSLRVFASPEQKHVATGSVAAAPARRVEWSYHGTLRRLPKAVGYRVNSGQQTHRRDRTH